MEIEMPENFPYETPPVKGDTHSFLVDAKYIDGKKWDILTIDGVPAGSPGKANAPGDMGEAPMGEEEEPPDEAAAETPMDEAAEPAPEDQLGPPSIGSAFAKKAMAGE